MELRARDIDLFFDGLTEIHDEKERYSLEWAFEQGQKKMDFFKQDVIDSKLKSKCSQCKDNTYVNDGLQGLQKMSKGLIKKNKWYARLFSNMYSVLSLVEIIISFLLVMGLSEISHSSAEFIDSRMFSLIFAGTFAFLKVIIERYWVKPVVEKWGWKLYRNSIDTLREKTLTIYYNATKNRETALVSKEVQEFGFQLNLDSNAEKSILA